MIVVFKTGRSLTRQAARDKPPDRPITAVEKCRRYLIWWITIIKYNLKARAALTGPFQPTGIADIER
jgi:hypothetical protein